MALPIINSPTPLATISQEITFHVKHEIQEVELNVLNIDFAEIRETI